MSKCLPDEYFRQAVSKSSDVCTASPEDASSAPSGGHDRRPRGVSLWLVVANCVAATLVEAVGTRLIMQQDAENPSPTPTPPTSNVLDPAPCDGAVIPVSASHAAGKCSQDGGDRADTLLDNRAGTVQRCPGAGVGEVMSFAFRPDVELVGVRIISGDTTGQSYQAGCRILTVHWTFSDGSWAVQPLDVSHPRDQEVRFPPVAIDDVLMTVLSVTELESLETTTNAVAISHVEFLGRS